MWKFKFCDLYCRCIVDVLNNYVIYKVICNKIIEENIYGVNVYFMVCLERWYMLKMEVCLDCFGFGLC